MDQIKIGKFIAERRKKLKLTQVNLAEKLNITDRAISKWENGKSMPDSSIMIELCSILKISVNELLKGECMKDSEMLENIDDSLLEFVKEKELSDKRLLFMEFVIGYMSSLIFIILIFVSSFLKMEACASCILIGVGVVTFFIGMFFCLRIEQVAGYYKCSRCGHTHVPSYGSIFIAIHFGRTRYLKCPNCKKWSFQKKVISK